MNTEILPIVTEKLLNSIAPSKEAGRELMAKQFESGQAVIILKDDSGSEIERFEYQADEGMTGKEFESSLVAESLKLLRAAS